VERGTENAVCCINVAYTLCTLWGVVVMYVVYVYIVGRGVQRIADMFCIDGFVLICLW
jgi:hypothetical protein